MIIVQLINHYEERRIRVDAKNEYDFSFKIRKIKGRRWSKTKVCWHIPYDKKAYNELQTLFGKQNIKVVAPTIQTKQVVSKPKSVKIIEPEYVIYKKEDRDYKQIIGEKAIVNQIESNKLAVFIPRNRANWVEIVRQIRGRIWRGIDRSWEVPLYQDTIDQLNQIKHIHYNFEIPNDLPDAPNVLSSPKPSKYTLNQYQQRAISALEEKLTLERKSWRTIKSYRTHLKHLFLFYPNLKPSQITNKQIQKYILHKIKNDKIAETTQNQLINAIVAFYKRVLKQHVKLEGITRPKRAKNLPNVFSKQEISNLITCLHNTKHKTMLALIYSAGLRKSEVINLRKRDIIFQRRCIFVKGGKGKKDRYVLLAEKAVELLRSYLSIYNPRYWLFEGQKGGQYGERSLQSVFEKAKEQSQVNPFVTLHGLRHSFATHLVETNVPLHVIKDLLGHNNIKTTEVYLHISNKYRSQLQSPLDQLDI